MSPLKATRVERYGKPVDRVAQKAAEDHLRVTDLRLEKIDGPNGIARSRSELHEEHLAGNELVGLAALNFATTRVLRPNVRLLLEIARDLRVARVLLAHATLERHGESVTLQYLAVFRDADDIDVPSLADLLVTDRLDNPYPQLREERPAEYFASEESIPDDDGIGAVILLPHEAVEHRPLGEFPVHLDPRRRGKGRRPPYHWREVPDPLDTEVLHHPAEGRCSGSRDMLPRERREIGRRRDHLEAVLVVARIDDADELRHERVELDPVVAAICPDQGDRGGLPGHDPPHLAEART